MMIRQEAAAAQEEWESSRSRSTGSSCTMTRRRMPSSFSSSSANTTTNDHVRKSWRCHSLGQRFYSLLLLVLLFFLDTCQAQGLNLEIIANEQVSSEVFVVTYRVSVNGNRGAANVRVLDPRPNNQVLFLSGDDNNDNILDPQEAWIFQATASTPLDLSGTTTGPSVAAELVLPNAPSQPTSAAPVVSPTIATTTTTTTAAATFAPTDSPTLAPSASPSLSPTTIPSIAPTTSPSIAPTTVDTTLSPTESPSAAPTTSFPTSWPSTTPSTSFPSLAPSVQPSTQPTEVPTITPTTPSPTLTPTLRPTVTPGNPTATPSHQPTDQPSYRPTDIPSQVPSSRPSLADQVSVTDVRMLLSQTPGLVSGGPAFTLGRAISAHLRQSILKQYTEEAFTETLQVEVILGPQESIVPTTTRRLLLRTLQTSDTATNLSTLQVDVDVQISYKSAQTYDAETMVGDAFNSQEKRTSFVNRLTQSGEEFFQNLFALEVFVEGEIPKEETVNGGDPNSNGGGGGISMGIIAGAAGGATLVLAMVAVLVFRNSRDSPSSKEGEPVATALSSPHSSMAAEIVFNNRQDDVSTLGEPFGVLDGESSERDELTASVADYDLLKSQGRDRLPSRDESRVSSTVSGTTKLGYIQSSSIFSDDYSFDDAFKASSMDERFEIDVPPGRLGMVVDTPHGGVPVVHAIKPDSVVFDTVRVGDMLIAVNGIDVTSYSAVQVSRLIGSTSKEARLLTFIRSNSNGTLEDSSKA